MGDAGLDVVEKSLGYVFKDRSILERSLVHASLAEERAQSNERMEFLGDAVLGLVVCERIYMRYPQMLEGEMTKIKSLVVSRQTCADIAKELGLDRALKVGKGMRGAGGEPPASLAAAALEAIIAAVYLDGGHAAAAAFILRHVDELIDEAAGSRHQQNFKSFLQQHAQQSKWPNPMYRVLDEQGPDHAKCFKVGVEIGERRFTPAWGQAKKRAEQDAALNALRELGVIDESSGGPDARAIDPE